MPQKNILHFCQESVEESSFFWARGWDFLAMREFSSPGDPESLRIIFIYLFILSNLFHLDYLRTFTKLFDVVITVLFMYKTTTLTKAGASCREITVSIHPSYFSLKILTTSKKLKHRNPFWASMKHSQTQKQPNSFVHSAFIIIIIN